VPTYEYECGSCHRVFEVRQRISEPSLTTCDVCGGPVRRLLSATPFILKGGGWYVTDYPSESRKKALDAEKSSGASTSSSDKSDKPASDKSDKPASDKPAAASTAKTDGSASSGSSGTSGASSGAAGPKSSD
jgi:putative FmdB family regulatory protein